MALTIWSFTPLILASIAAIALIALLRWRLRVPTSRPARIEGSDERAHQLSASDSPRKTAT